LIFKVTQEYKLEIKKNYFALKKGGGNGVPYWPKAFNQNGIAN